MEPRTRYSLYAAAATLAAVAYVGLGDETALTGEVATRPSAAALSLPELTSTGVGGAAAMKRDLFKVVDPQPPPPPPVISAAPETRPPPPPPPPADRLSDLKVIGVVTRGARLAILVEVGEEAITVETGEAFGKDAALTIDGISENRVLVTDKLANVSRTYTLSEE